MPSDYTLREVLQILGVPRGVVAGFIEAGLVTPQRGPRREYRFSFPDLVVLRAAQELLDAGLSPQRITRSLRRLREPLALDPRHARLRVGSDGAALVVGEGDARWRPETGQYVLSLKDDAPARVASLPRVRRAGGDVDWLRRGAELEASDADGACEAYRRAIDAAPAHPAPYVNLGRLLHELGRLPEARAVYEQALSAAAADATIWFNLAVVLEDLREPAAAIDAYARAVALEPEFADAHYNLALLHAAAGAEQQAVRHFNAYRQLTRAGG